MKQFSSHHEIKMEMLSEFQLWQWVLSFDFLSPFFDLLLFLWFFVALIFGVLFFVGFFKLHLQAFRALRRNKSILKVQLSVVGIRGSVCYLK